MKPIKDSNFKSQDVPKNIRQYEHRMRKMLMWILEGKEIQELSPWDCEILGACLSKGYIVNNLRSVRTANGSISFDLSGDAKLTHAGYEYLARIDAESRSRKAIIISVLALIISVVPLVINYAVAPILEWFSRR
mgnify:FL=1|nr:MAG TPA: hypothetical protein [Caudoviricetes sp.]